MLKDNAMQNLSHPGIYLVDELAKQNMSRKELSIRTGVTEKHISTVINGKKDISPSFAKKLEYALGFSASYWLSLQNEYDRALLDYEEEHQITKEEINILKPLSDISKYMNEIGMLNNGNNEAEQVMNLRKVLRVTSLLSIPEISYNAAYRAQISTNVHIDVYVLYAWQCVCEFLTKDIAVNKNLNKPILQKKLSLIKSLMFNEPNFIAEQLEKIFAECGIAFCIVKHFRGAPVQGFIKLTGDDHIILCITIRQARADIFWFTLFHEIAHILNDDMDIRFVDFSSVKSDIEARADKMARDILIDNKAYMNFVKQRDFSLENITNFANLQKVQPYIVIGRLQSDELIDWSCYTSSLVKYKWIEN